MEDTVARSDTFETLGLGPELLACLDELGHEEPTPVQEAASWGPELHVKPESGVTLGERGSIVRITGHFDDPAARTCRTTLSAEERERYPEDQGAASPDYAVFHCRLQFVVDAVERLGFIPLPTHPPQG